MNDIIPSFCQDKTLDYLRDIKLYQNKDGYRVSIDALLLYDFVKMPRIKKLMDFGAGSGIIGLLLAKKYLDCHVILVELQESLSLISEENIRLNKLDDRVVSIQGDIRELARDDKYLHSFDAVITNPPFRKVKTGLISPNDERAIARHETHLSLSQLLKSASNMLRHHGHFYMIYLPERLSEVLIKMKENSLEIKCLRFVHSFIDSPAKMILIEAVKGAKSGLKVLNPLIIYSGENSYSEEVLSIYKC